LFGRVLLFERCSITGVCLPYVSCSGVARSSKFILGLMQVGLCHVEFVPAREPVEDRHVHRKKGAKGWTGAPEVVRFCDADLQVRFGKVRVKRDLWIVLSPNPANLIFLRTSVG